MKFGYSWRKSVNSDFGEDAVKGTATIIARTNLVDVFKSRRAPESRVLLQMMS
jgi:hypothetical protein